MIKRAGTRRATLSEASPPLVFTFLPPVRREGGAASLGGWLPLKQPFLDSCKIYIYILHVRFF